MKGMDRRPHVQGDAAAMDVEVTDEVLTDAAGLAVIRSAWDRLGVGEYLDERLEKVGGHYRPSLHVEQWTSLLLYGGGCMDHLPLLESRGVRALFGWDRVVDPTSFGRFLRRAGLGGARGGGGGGGTRRCGRWCGHGGRPRAACLGWCSWCSTRPWCCGTGRSRRVRRKGTIRGRRGAPRTTRCLRFWTPVTALACSGGRETRTRRRGPKRG